MVVGKVIPKAAGVDEMLLMGSAADDVYGTSAEVEEATLSVVAGFRDRKRRDLVSCRIHPATLMIHKRAQYKSKAGRLHFFLPSTV